MVNFYRFALFVLALLFCNVGKAQTSSYIPWNANHKLNWQNFTALPIEKHFATALSDVGISFKSRQEGNQIIIETLAYFNPSKSWVKEKGKNNDYLLNHEQLHFDIVEWQMRLARKKIAQIKANPKTLNKKLNKAFAQCNKKMKKTQKKYDRQTNHSLKKEKQKYWDEKVKKGLQSTNKYNQTTIVLNLP